MVIHEHFDWVIDKLTLTDLSRTTQHVVKKKQVFMQIQYTVHTGTDISGLKFQRHF